MPEGLTINGVALDTYATWAPSVAGLLTVPARRGDLVTVPGRHGAIATPKMFEPNDVVLPLVVNGAEADGSIPIGSTAAEEWYLRRDELLRVLYADPLVLEFTRPDGSSRSARAQVTDVLEFDRAQMNPTAQVNVGLSLFEGFWFDTLAVSQTISGTTGVVQPLTAFEGATAPMAELTITFDGPINNPILQHGPDRFVQYNGAIAAGRQLVVNTASWTVTPGTGALWAPDPRQVSFSPGPRWLELDPTLTAFEVQLTHTGGGTASCSIAGRRHYLAP